MYGYMSGYTCAQIELMAADVPVVVYKHEKRDKKGNVVGAPKGDVAMIEKVNEIILKATEDDLFIQWYEAAAEEAKSQGL